MCRHLLECAEWAPMAPSRVAPQKLFPLLSLQNKHGTGAFLFLSRNNPRKESMTMAAMKEIPYKIYLEENEMPQAWYNVRADMKNKPAPLLNPPPASP